MPFFVENKDKKRKQIPVGEPFPVHRRGSKEELAVLFVSRARPYQIEITLKDPGLRVVIGEKIHKTSQVVDKQNFGIFDEETGAMVSGTYKSNGEIHLE